MTKKAEEVTKSTEKIYEIGFHLISSIAEEQVPAEVEKIKAVLAKQKATILSEEAPKLRPLAYEIKKSFEGVYKTFDKAYFGFIKFSLPEEGDVNVIDAAVKANLQVLRYIIVKTVAENTMYSPKMGIFSDKEPKAVRPASVEPKAAVSETHASEEEIDKSIESALGDVEEAAPVVA